MVRVGSDNGCSIYSDEKSSGGRPAAGANEERSGTAPEPIVDPSWAPVNPAHVIGVDLGAVTQPNYPSLNQFSGEHRKPIGSTGAPIDPSPEEYGRPGMVIVWIVVAFCIWAGIFGYMVIG